MSASVEWIDAETPHAKVPRNGRTSNAGVAGNDTAAQEMAARIRQLETSLLREAREQPLVIRRNGR